jgi:hypothetical protein
LDFGFADALLTLRFFVLFSFVGQINLLRRMFDAPVGFENYFRAEIEIGRVGAEQSANRIGLV